MLSLNDFIGITESIDIVNGSLVFDYNSSSSGISSSFGKGKSIKPFVKTVDGLFKSYSLYQAKSDSSTQIMKALKSADFSDSNIQAFLNRSAIYATRVMKSQNIDIIVTPHSSSDLTKEFVKQIQRRTNYDIYYDSFQKQPNLENVSVDYDHPKMTDAIARSMEKIISRGVKSGFLSVKMFSPQHRKFVKNLFTIVDENLTKKIDGKHVMIIDDVMTSGTTAKSIYNILISGGAESVSALTIFKSS